MANPPADEPAAPVAEPTKPEGRAANRPTEDDVAALLTPPPVGTEAAAPLPDLGLPPVLVEDHQELLSLIAQVALVQHGVTGLAESDQARLLAFLNDLSPTEARTLAYSLATTAPRPQDVVAPSPASTAPSPAVLPASGVAAEAPAWTSSTPRPTSGLAEDAQAYQLGSSSAMDQEMARTGSAGGAAAARDTSVVERRAPVPDGDVSVVPIAARGFATAKDDRDLSGAEAPAPQIPTDVATSVASEPSPDTVQPIEPTAPFDPLPIDSPVIEPTAPADPTPDDPTNPPRPINPPSTDPTAPIDPTAPTDPAGPTNPPSTDPSEPTNPTPEPTNPAEPTDPPSAEPAEPPGSIDPPEPVDPLPTDPTAPPDPIASSSREDITGGGAVTGHLDFPDVAATTSAEPRADLYVIGADGEVVYPTADELWGFEDVPYGTGGPGLSPEAAQVLLHFLDRQDAADGLASHDHGDLLLALTEPGEGDAPRAVPGGYGGPRAAFETFRGGPDGDGRDRMDDAPAEGGNDHARPPADDPPPAPWVDDGG